MRVAAAVRRLVAGAVCLGVLASPSARAGPLTPEPFFWRIDQGSPLERAQAVAFCQDRRGFLWIGTRDAGLFRYDGYRLKQYVHDPGDPASLGGNRVWALAADRDGRIWVGTFGDGLDRLDPVTERFEHFRRDPKDPTSLANDTISSLLVDGHGRLWIGTYGGGLDRLALSERGSAKPRFEHLRHTPGDPLALGHDEVWTLGEDGAGGLWVGLRWAGVDHLTLDASGRPASLRRYRHDPGDESSLSSEKVWCASPSADGTLWVGTFGGGVNRIDPRSGRVTRVPVGSSTSIIRSILEDSRGVLWIAEAEKSPVNGPGRAFLAQLDARTFDLQMHIATEEDSPPGPPVRTNGIFEDAEGLIWFGTWGNGVSAVDPRTSRFGLVRHHPEDATSLGEGAVNAVLEDSWGRLWAGTDEGLFLRTSAPGQPPRFRKYARGRSPAFQGGSVSCLHEDRAGTLWVSAGGLHTLDLRGFDPESPRFTYLPDVPSHPLGSFREQVTSILQDRRGVYWLATRARGLLRWDGQALASFQHDPKDPTSLAFDVTWSVFEDSAGAVWVGTENGLCRVGAGGRFERFIEDPRDPGSLSGKPVSAIAEDSKGNLWVGTRDGGLNRLDRRTGRFERFTERQGLASNLVMRILVDGRDRLWLSGRGLQRVDPRTGDVARFDERDGVVPNFVSFGFEGAAFRGKSGLLYFGGADGLNAFDPEAIRESPRRPPVVVTDFLLFNRSVAVTRAGPLTKEPSALTELTLAHAQDLFAFEFASLSFRRPSRNRYAYRLEGVSRDWIEAGADDRKAVYTRLSPGRYVFRVKATNADGVWNEAGAAVTVTILPPWWLSWWFKSLLAVAFVLSPVAWVRLRTRRLLRHQRELEVEVEARTRELVTKGRTIEEQAQTLERQNEALRESARLQADVERMSRHDLKTPLASIVSIPKLLLSRPGIGEEEAELLKLVELAGYRVLGLVNLSLDLFRMEKGTYAFQPRAIDLVDVARRVTGDLEAHADSKGVSFRVARDDGEEAPGTLLARAEELLSYSMLANLVKNALEASPEGARVTLSFARRGADVSVRVHNEGVVPASIRERFFEKYTSAGKEGGTGLGTYSARLMAETQRGRIEMTTSELEGTSVTVHLQAADASEAAEASTQPRARPLVERPRAAPRVPTSPAPAGLPALRVLLVDDEPGNVAVLRSALPSPPLLVDSAINGRAALDRVAAFDPDVVFMDAVMPVMGGLEAATRIRAREADRRPARRVTLVCLSSHEDPESHERMRAAGFDRVLRKPVERDELMAVLLEAAGAPAAEVAVADVAPTATRRADGFSGVDVESALRRLSGNERLLARLVRELKDRHGDAPGLAREALDRGDLEEVARIAHTLRGAAANLSATGVASAARRLESALEEGGPAGAALDDLARALDALGAPAFGESPAPRDPAETMPAGGLAAALESLDSLLARGSLDAQAAFERLRPALAGRGVDEDVRRLEEEIAAFEHSTARETLSALRKSMGLSP